MKQKRKPMSVKKKLTISVLLVIPTMLLLAKLPGIIFRKFLSSNNNDAISRLADHVSNEKVFTSNTELKPFSAGIPSGNNTKAFNEIGVYWSKDSVADGTDTCIIYDKNTYQIYARTFTTSGFNATGTIETGTTYFKNDLVSKENAKQILEDYCYKYN